jgi:2-polyprenyl-6-methoxyphenol hydroxylase-like FAD-dependent oxidoreductase
MQRRSTVTDSVLIIGAGPVGMTLALELTRYRVPVRIVDRAAARTDKSKAVSVWSRTLELFDRNGCSADMIASGNPTDCLKVINGDATVARLDFREVQTVHPYFLMLPQSETERILEEHLAQVGVTVERNTELVGFSQAEGGVSAALRRADGTQETMQASWMVGCDGAHSLIRQELGLTFLGSTRGDDWALADLEATGVPYPDTQVSIIWHRDGPLVLFPLHPGRYRLIARIGPSRGEHPPVPILEEFQQIIDRCLRGVVLTRAIWTSGFRINEHQADRYRVGRVFIAGDAAHIHSPVGGQGMNTGMQDAFNLAWKLALACHAPDAAPPLLDSYEAERKPVGREVIDLTARITSVATLSSVAERAVRGFAAHLLMGLPPVRHLAEDMLTEVAIGYPRSPLNGPPVHLHGLPAAGERILPDKGDEPFGTGRMPRFAVLGEVGRGFDALRARHGAYLEPEVRLPPFGEGIWLVRPDGYVATVARSGDWKAVDAYLDGLGLNAPSGRRIDVPFAGTDRTAANGGLETAVGTLVALNEVLSADPAQGAS